LRGFEAEEAKIKQWRGTKETLQPVPSTSGLARPPIEVASRGRQDPLAQARFEWNRGITAEYKAKFEKWTKMKKDAEKNGTKPGIFCLNIKR
jgi:hypothetical protein